MPELDGQKVWEQLYLLREQTRTTGALFDAQVLQLKMWGRLAAPHSDKVQFTWKNDRKDDKSITFEARSDSDPPLNFSILLAGLDRSVKDLLGPDWTVVFYNNGEMVLNSPAKS